MELKGGQKNKGRIRKDLAENNKKRRLNVKRDSRDRPLIDIICPKCGENRTIIRRRLDKYGLVCKSCSVKETFKEYHMNNGHGYNYRGSKYFGKSIIWKWENHAVTRDLEWNLTYDFLDRLYDNQKGKCALSGVLLSFDRNNPDKVSLDRIDSSKGYTEDNVQFVAACVNKMKGNLTDDNLIKICNMVSKTHPII